MTRKLFFRWEPDTRIVYGARRAAIYDFRNGTVFSLNSVAAEIARLIDGHLSIEKMSTSQQAFVEKLRELQLGEVIETPVQFYEDTPVEKKHPLNFLWLELTGGCNLGCAHCYAESQNPLLFPASISTSTESALAFQDWRNILSQGAALGCQRVQFIGGEVLLYPRLFELIDLARADGYSFIEIYTNGTLLTDKKIDALASRGVHVAVSLHGTQAETHDAVTGLTGSFKRTISGLRRLRDCGVRVRIAGVAMRQNQHDILQLGSVAEALGISEVSFDVVRSIGSGREPGLMPDAPAVLAEKWLTWPNFVAKRVDYEHNKLWNPCWAGKLAITTSGDVMPCVMGRSQVVGNLRLQSLAEVLNSPQLLLLWGLTKDQVAVCRDCEYRYVCGDCRPLALGGGDLHGAIPRCTYAPQNGVWRQLKVDDRLTGPAPEADEPVIAPCKDAPEGLVVNFILSNDKPHFKCDPDTPQSSFHQDDFSQKHNGHFRCDPER